MAEQSRKTTDISAATGTAIAGAGYVAKKGVTRVFGQVMGSFVPGAGNLVATAATETIIRVNKAINKVRKALGLVGKDFNDTAARTLRFSGALVTASLLSVGITIGVGLIGGGILVALLMFIINSGAYVVPYRGGGGGGSGGIIGPIELTEGCPQGWPVTGPARVNFGPYTSGGTHAGREALDINVRTGTPIYATHSGVIIRLFNPEDKASAGGYKIRIASLCNGVAFYSAYLHLSSSPRQNGERVVAGDLIALSDNTGTLTTGPHLHYEFLLGSGLAAGTPARYPDKPPFMAPPFIPKLVPRGCNGPSACNTTIP